MDEITPANWIAACAGRLQDHWRTAETGQLQEVAISIWQDAKLRAMLPEDAAVTWLKPVVPTDPGQD